jgi:NAD-dependent deacetylase
VAALEQAGRLELCVTQNIDGLHLVAGTSRGKLVELHGTDRAIECQGCHARSEPAPAYEAFGRARVPPRCASCGGLLKPATISFGQSLDEEELGRAVAGAEAADLVLALGSTLSVTPASTIPLIAAERGAPYVIINRGETAHDGHPAVALRLEGDVAEILAPAVAAIPGRSG